MVNYIMKTGTQPTKIISMTVYAPSSIVPKYFTGIVKQH